MIIGILAYCPCRSVLGHAFRRRFCCDISVTRLSQRDPWAFRPILADSLVLSYIIKKLDFLGV